MIAWPLPDHKAPPEDIVSFYRCGLHHTRSVTDALIPSVEPTWSAVEHSCSPRQMPCRSPRTSCEPITSSTVRLPALKAGRIWRRTTRGMYPIQRRHRPMRTAIEPSRRHVAEPPPMWTTENRARYDRNRLRYPRDLTDAEWALIEPCIPPAKRGGNKRSVNVREIVNGLMYILSTGCQWREIQKDLPPRSTLYDYFDLWSWDRTKHLQFLFGLVGAGRLSTGASAAGAYERSKIPRAVTKTVFVCLVSVFRTKSCRRLGRYLKLSAVEVRWAGSKTAYSIGRKRTRAG